MSIFSDEKSDKMYFFLQLPCVCVCRQDIFTVKEDRRLQVCEKEEFRKISGPRI
jgi:hypothetical protein